MKQLLLMLVTSMLLFSCVKQFKKESVQEPPKQQSEVLCKLTTQVSPEMRSKIASMSHTPARYASSGASAITEVLYLDFNGGWAGPNWGVTLTPSGLVAGQITEIIKNVEEDYSLYVHTITTDSNVYNATPTGRRVKCILGANYTTYYPGTGGVSFIGSALPGYILGEQPCLVNSATSLSNIALAVSHEMGHTLGLYHQTTGGTRSSPCTIGYSYNVGVGPAGSAVSWGPIMGAVYTRTIITWARGLTDEDDGTGCPELQDEFAVLNATMPYVADVDADYLNSSNISSLRQIGRGGVLTGVLGLGDVDFVKVNPAITGGVTVNLTNIPPYPPGYIGNSDIRIVVYTRANLLGTFVIYAILGTNTLNPGITGETFLMPTLPKNGAYLGIVAKPTPLYQPFNDVGGQWVLSIN